MTRLTTRNVSNPVGQAFWIGRIIFTVAPILFGLDKFFNVLVDWPKYLAPWIPGLIHVSPHTFMYGIGLVEIGAGILVGSSAMLAEAALSAADTLNQAFLLASLRRGERPADSRHPFGYGQERYFWSLLAAFGILAAGAGFSSRACSPCFRPGRAPSQRGPRPVSGPGWLCL